MESVTLEQAVERALKNNPTVAQAAQGILRAEALLQQARAVTLPNVNASFTGLLNSTERRFDDVVTSPRMQGTFSASASMPILAAASWAARNQARDQVEVANLSTADVRTNIAVATAQAYLAIIAAKRQVDVSLRARETSLAHLDYARRRLEAGAGTRLNELRAAQEVSSNEARLEVTQLGVRIGQEALGVLMAANGPVDAASEPNFEVPAVIDEAGWMSLRPDLRLFAAQERAADRVWRDSSKDWFPTGCRLVRSAGAGAGEHFHLSPQLEIRRQFFPADFRQRTAARGQTPARVRSQCVEAGADRAADSRAIGGAARPGHRSHERARAHQPSHGRPAGAGSAEHHELRVSGRRDDKPRSDRCAAPGEGCGFSRRGCGKHADARAIGFPDGAWTLSSVEIQPQR